MICEYDPDEGKPSGEKDLKKMLGTTAKNSKYTHDEKLNAVMRYVSCGNMKAVSRETGIPYMTIVEWKRSSEWWDDVVQECKKRWQEDLDGNMTGVIHDIMGGIAERIQDGDSVYDSKTGQIVRVPIKGKELATIAGILFDKRAAMRGDPTNITKQTTSSEQLKALESKFKEFSQALESSGAMAKPIEGSTDAS